MKLYAIRDKNTQEFMPLMKNGKGSSYWLHDDIKDNRLPIPRLLVSEKQAKKVIVEWAKGIFEWQERHVANAWDDGPEWVEQHRVIKDVGRNKDMLEVVPFELKELV